MKKQKDVTEEIEESNSTDSRVEPADNDGHISGEDNIDKTEAPENGEDRFSGAEENNPERETESEEKSSAEENVSVDIESSEVTSATEENILVENGNTSEQNISEQDDSYENTEPFPEDKGASEEIVSEKNETSVEEDQEAKEFVSEIENHDEEDSSSQAFASENGNEKTAVEDHVPEERSAQEEDASAEKKPDNAAFISQQIDKLIQLKDEHNFTDFWFYVKELNKTIFTLRGIPKDERMKFKDRISQLCDDAKKIQDEVKAKVAKTSHLKLERIQQILDEALSFGMTHEELEKSFFKIEEAGKFLREGTVQTPEGEESADMSREHREQAKEIIKAGKDKIFDRKREIRDANFKKVTQRLNAISDSLLSSGRAQKVFDGVKSLRFEMKSMNLDRAQLREIDNVIETLWKKAREKATTGRVHEAKSQISGLEDLARRKVTFIQTLEKEIKDLNLKWSTVKNDFFKNRVNEWIEEKKEKIEATQKEIESTREKIKFLAEQMQRTNPA